jgi:hypothetical protein
MIYVKHPRGHEDFEHFTEEFQSELLNRFNQLQLIAEELNSISSECLSLIFSNVHANIRYEINQIEKTRTNALTVKRRRRNR